MVRILAYKILFRRIKTISVLGALVFSVQSSGQDLRIGLLNELNTNAVVFTIIHGNYLMQAGDEAIHTFKAGTQLFIEKSGDSVKCFDIKTTKGLFKTVKFTALSDSACFSLRSAVPASPLRYYDDNLELSVNLGKLQTVNVVDIDKYLAGVVESEGGVRATLEFYKTQAILCRTYAMSHLDRHLAEGFFLCDGVHCQAYKGQHTGSKLIVQGAFETRSLVVIDTDSIFITAAFHSNCGGETESSANVWLLKKKYLKPIQDPYCQGQKNYNWEWKISIEQWKQYLINNGYRIPNDVTPSFFNTTQFSRKQYYILGKDSITFRKIRNDFRLRSAFFSIEIKDNTLLFHGRGYGHGVGLCQEGAIQMSKLGYNFMEIIDFYYQGVNIIPFARVPSAKNPSLKSLIKHSISY